MPFVQRNNEGTIIGVFANRQPSTEDGEPAVADEWLEDDNQEVIDALKPPPKTEFTPLEFLERFSEGEQVAVVEATMANAQIKLWYDKMLAATFVDVSDPRTEAGLGHLVGAGLINESRKGEILAVE